MFLDGSPMNARAGLTMPDQLTLSKWQMVRVFLKVCLKSCLINQEQCHALPFRWTKMLDQRKIMKNDLSSQMCTEFFEHAPQCGRGFSRWQRHRHPKFPLLGWLIGGFETSPNYNRYMMIDGNLLLLLLKLPQFIEIGTDLQFCIFVVLAIAFFIVVIEHQQENRMMK